MLTTGSTHLAVSRGQQTWYHFGSIATCDRHLPIAYVTFILAVCCSSDATGLYILRHYRSDINFVNRRVKCGLYFTRRKEEKVEFKKSKIHSQVTRNWRLDVIIFQDRFFFKIFANQPPVFIISFHLPEIPPLPLS